MVKNLLPAVLCCLILCNHAKKTFLPKIEISMLLEELTSQEAKEYRRKQTRQVTVNQVPNSSDSNNSTSLSSEADAMDDDSTTSDLISSVSEKPESEIVDYDVTTATPEESDGPEMESETETTTSSSKKKKSKPKPQRPMLLSAFANHLAGGLKERPETTTLPLPDFPTPKPEIFSSPPDEDFPMLVTAAKDFIRRYLSPEQWRKLRILLKTIREVGGSRVDIHRAATTFISKVISKTEMSEITERKNELFRTFNRRYFDKPRS